MIDNNIMVMELERYREDQHCPCARMTRTKSHCNASGSSGESNDLTRTRKHTLKPEMCSACMISPAFINCPGSRHFP